MKTIKRQTLLDYLDDLLLPETFKDYGPNGLQVEGKEEIKIINLAVSATLDSITKSVQAKADCLITHHGILWDQQGSRTITGPWGKRIISLAKNNINLISYHLPLDGGLRVGTAKALADRLELINLSPFGKHKEAYIGVKGKLIKPMKLKTLAEKLKVILKHPIILSSPDDKKEISKIGIITGGGQTYWNCALKEETEVFITGEMSEYCWHDVSEAGIHMLAGGHNATEQLGVIDLMERIKKDLGAECYFLSSLNPA